MVSGPPGSCGQNERGFSAAGLAYRADAAVFACVFFRGYADFHGYFRRLYTAYTQFGTLEDALKVYSGITMEKLCAFLEVSAKSPQKKLNMFLRWMIRRDSEVDLGIWESFDRRDLIVPLDTHVCRVAHYFKLTDVETFSLKNARQITAALATVFPDDPCLGDFALFGLGVNGEI